MKPPTRHDSRQLVILTGLSGSGKSTVLHAFEDMGFYCVDNLPIELIPIFAELHAAGRGDADNNSLLLKQLADVPDPARGPMAGRTIEACTS